MTKTPTKTQRAVYEDYRTEDVARHGIKDVVVEEYGLTTSGVMVFKIYSATSSTVEPRTVLVTKRGVISTGVCLF